MTLRRQTPPRPSLPSEYQLELPAEGTSHQDTRRGEVIPSIDAEDPNPDEATVREETPKPAPHSAPHSSAPPKTEQRLTEHSKNEEAVIIIMGVTGAGKSSFISLLTDEAVGIGHDLESHTTDPALYRYLKDDGPSIQLIDTPGFNDTHRSDTEILMDIAYFLTRIYSQKKRVAGILYLHRITDVRMQGSALKNLQMFEKLCGKECLPHVVLATTMWGSLPSSGADQTIGEDRERQLRDDRFWGHLLKGGSQIMRHTSDAHSAKSIISNILSTNGSVVLDIQRELVDEQKSLEQTAAGQHIQGDLIQVRKRYERDLQDLRDSAEEAIKDKDAELVLDLAAQQKEFEARLSKANSDGVQLSLTHDALMIQKNREYTQRLQETKREEDTATQQLNALQSEHEIAVQQLAEMQEELQMRDRDNRSAMAKVKREQRRTERHMERKFEALEAKDQWRDLERAALVERIEAGKRAQWAMERNVEELARAMRKKKSTWEMIKKWIDPGYYI